MQRRVLRIGIPLRALTPGGVTRFTIQLATALARRPEECEVHTFFNDEKTARALVGCRLHYVAGRNRLVWDYVSFPLVARRYPLDVVIYPSNIIPMSDLLLRGGKRLNVIHDLAYFNRDLNEYKLLDTVYQRGLMGVSCRIADRTVAVSQSTRRDLVSVLGLSAETITVVHHGIEPVFGEVIHPERTEAILAGRGVRRPYMFYCGSLSPRKNILRALKALKELEHRTPHMLYLAGGNSWHDQAVRDYYARELRGRVVHLGHLSEEELRVLYANADLFLYPSLYEGFGLPILEAQASGCPVLTSTLKSCSEVAGKGAQYVDGESVESIREGMLKVIHDRVYRQQLIDEGRRNVEQFSWERCAARYLEIMKAIQPS